ncbi:hypothetical protein AXF42_Ash015385 [Apostasia shenzhenica]|uniref:PAR1 protein n=1 Tax=Apostasia shenzhenica TaxID=1088818 RepID=A0A2H9ZS27_9ASPA|nr:hypothetical protein AXF42_Ash015385 [Apostasia shenzhenica]
MASRMMIPMAVFLSLYLLLPSSLASVICEDLPQDQCAFSISSGGKRCILESYHKSGSGGGGGRTEYRCRTSEVAVERQVSDWIESDDCVRACGVDRRTVGISSDSLLDARFTRKLCSPSCYQSCPNIVDLYFNLAAAEGVFLPDLCEARRSNPHRSMAELVLSSGAAAGPASAGEIADDSALAPSPSSA